MQLGRFVHVTYRIDPVPESTLKNIRAVSSTIWNTNRALWLRSLSTAWMTRGLPPSPRTTLLTGAASLIAPTYLLRGKKRGKCCKRGKLYWYHSRELHVVRTQQGSANSTEASQCQSAFSFDPHWYLICWKTGGLSLTSPTWMMTVVLASTPAMLRACTTSK